MTALLLLLVVVVGCTETGRDAYCSGPSIRAEPARAAPAETFRLRGGAFSTGDCEDPGKPLKNIRIDFRQGGKTWHLATVDAASDYTFDVKVRVPADARPGSAVITVTASNVGEKKQRFRVLKGGGSTAP